MRVVIVVALLGLLCPLAHAQLEWNPVASTIGRTLVLQLIAGQTAERSLQPGIEDVYVFSTAGQKVVSVEFEPDVQNVELRVVSSGGTSLLQTRCKQNVLCRKQLLFAPRGENNAWFRVDSPSTIRTHYSLYVTSSDSISGRAEAALAAFRDMQRAEELMERQDAASVAEAISLYGNVLSRWEDLKDQLGKAEVESRIGDAYGALSNHKAALNSYQQAAALYHEIDDSSGFYYTRLRIARSLSQLKDLQLSVQLMKSANDFFREKSDPYGSALGQQFSGDVQLKLGDARHAMADYRSALESWNSLGETVRASSTLSGIATAHAHLVEIETAFEIYREVLPVLRQSQSRNETAAALIDMALMFQQIGEFQKGLDAGNEALSIARETGNRNAEANALRTLGLIYMNSGDTEQPLKFYEPSLSLWNEIADATGEAITWNALGVYYHDQSEFLKALDCFQKANDLSATSGSIRNQAEALKNKARSEFQLQQMDAALKDVDRAYGLFVQLNDLSGEASCLETRAQFATGSEALDLYSQALQRLRQTKDRPELARVLLQAARVLRAKGDLKRAAEQAQESIRILENIRSELLSHSLRISYFSAVRDAYEFYVDLLYELNQSEPGSDVLAFRVSEGARARGFSDFVLSHDAIGPSQATPSSLEEIQQALLGPDTVLLEFLLGKEKSYAWAITQTEHLMVPIAASAELETKVLELYRLMHERSADSAELLKITADLSGMLLVPLERLLDRNRILISADGVLQYLPFAMLSLDGEKAPLGIQHQISYVPSATSVRMLREFTTNRKPPGKMIAMFADPVFDPDDPRIRRPKGLRHDTILQQAPTLTRIPFTSREANAITGLVQQGQTLVFTGSDANRAALESGRLKEYKYIHFATHGVVEASNPDASMLALSLFDRNGVPLRGFITPDDISQLQLNAELAVLSGCDTAIGKQVRGEGLLGFGRAFLYAGAKRVLATVWSVEDAAMVDIMRHYYSALIVHHLSPAAALQDTQRYLWRQPKYRSPYYWAPFILIGETD